MIRISLCMIVKNEEDVLDRCLSSVEDIVDEIIIVDTGSTDNTKKIAQAHQAKVFDFPWVDDFSKARNASFSKASMEYCMWLDADDILLEQDRKALKELKESLDSSVDVVMLRYHTNFDENGNPTFSYYRERIIKHTSKAMWKGAVHEVISPFGKVIYSEIAITHSKLHPSDPDRNIRIFEGLIKKGITLNPREQYYYGRELYYHKRYEEAIAVLSCFLEMPGGWVEDQVEACRHIALCYSRSGFPKKAIQSLLASFQYGLPRAEICCDLGKHLMDQGRYPQAAYWYEVALSKKQEERKYGFILPDCYHYTPCIQLCVCYSRMGNMKLAEEYNEKAGQAKPKDPSYLYNKEYFEKMKQK